MGDRGKRLEGRVAIVTGASRGLGRALATSFAGEGAAVAVAARTLVVSDPRLPGTVHETAAIIDQAGGRAVAVPCDVTVAEDLERLVETAQSELGQVDILVNNAALTVPGRPGTPVAPATGPVRPPSLVDTPLKGFRRHFEVNLFAAYRLTQLVLAGMIKLGRGSIINVSSDGAHRPGEGPYPAGGGPLPFAYGCSKAALEHLTQSVAYEVARHGIAVNALLPSRPIATPGLQYFAPDLDDVAPADAFAEAAVRLALETPATVTGRIAYSDDILHPELGRRHWLGSV